MSLLSLPATPATTVRGERFRLRNAESGLETVSGVTQVTSFPDHRWSLQIQVIPMRGTNLKAWALFALRMSSLANWFAYGPPHYSGVGTSYAGASPVVMGANQLGSSLVVDGLTNSVAILAAGDFFSFDTVSPYGNTNRQLNAVTAAVSSNGSGQATFPLLYPIRQAPADNAAVNISTPTAFFRLVEPENGIELDVENFSPFFFDVVERIFP